MQYYCFAIWQLKSIPATLDHLISIVPTSFQGNLIIYLDEHLCVCRWAQLCLTPCDPTDGSPSGSSVHGILHEKSTEVDCHFLLQGLVPSQGLNLNLLPWQADSLYWATWEVACKTLILYPLNDNLPLHLGSLPVNHQKLIQKHETYTLPHSSLK